MSFEIRHVLLPTDFSETADKALPYALAIAEKTGAKLTLMHSIEEPYNFAPMIEEFAERTKTEVHKKLEDLILTIQKDEQYTDIEIGSKISFGRTVLSILEDADELEADVIVMGTTGASGINKILFGSQTSEVILNAEIPVLAVPAESEFDGLPHITFLTDYRDGDLKALEQVAQLGAYFKADITTLHVEKELNLKAELTHRGFKDIVSNQVNYEPLKFELVIQDELIAGINEFLALERSSLLTMVKYEKPFFQKLVTKSHSKEMGFYSTLPLLIVPGKNPY